VRINRAHIGNAPVQCIECTTIGIMRIANKYRMEKRMVDSLSRFNSRIVVAAAAALLAFPAFAHSGGHAFGLTAGLAHPLTGWDHLLAMLAVGVWSAHYKRPVRWLLPLLFPVVMLLGALAGMAGVYLPGSEPGIAGSVAVLGLLIAFAVRLPAWASAVTVASFALVHGYAHGVELPWGASPLMYGAGFVIATLALHAAGLALGGMASRNAAGRVVRLAGAGMAAAGAYLLAAA
jgi:urease accessory protein